MKNGQVQRKPKTGISDCLRDSHAGAGLSGAKRTEGALTVVSEEKLPTANTLSTVRNSMATLHVACLEASLWRFVQHRQFARRIRLEFASFRGRRYPGNIVSAAPLPIHCFT